MSKTEVVVTCEMVMEPEAGLWCDSCCLPSAISVRAFITSATRIFGEMIIAKCVDCGKRVDECTS